MRNIDAWHPVVIEVPLSGGCHGRFLQNSDGCGPYSYWCRSGPTCSGRSPAPVGSVSGRWLRSTRIATALLCSALLRRRSIGLLRTPPLLRLRTPPLLRLWLSLRLLPALPWVRSRARRPIPITVQVITGRPITLLRDASSSAAASSIPTAAWSYAGSGPAIEPASMARIRRAPPIAGLFSSVEDVAETG